MRATADPGLPLAHYRQHGAGVWLTCLDSMDAREFDFEMVIRRLGAWGAPQPG